MMKDHRLAFLPLLALLIALLLPMSGCNGAGMPARSTVTTKATDHPAPSIPPTKTSPSPKAETTPTQSPIAPTDTPTATPVNTQVETQAESQALTITILYDNTAYDPRLRADWGFAALIEYDDQVVLFDTGANGAMLMDHMALLGIDHQSIDTVVLSHIHGDHTNGLQRVLDTGVTPTVYAPTSFPAAFKRQVRAYTDLVEIGDSVEIIPGLHSTGELGASIVEQALVVETGAGIVVITGCAHPGIVQIVQRAKALVEGEVALLVGGFHLMNHSPDQVRQIIAALHELEVHQVCPTHCTGDRAIAIFAEEYGATPGDGYIQGGAGRVITIPATD